MTQDEYAKQNTLWFPLWFGIGIEGVLNSCLSSPMTSITCVECRTMISIYDLFKKDICWKHNLHKKNGFMIGIPILLLYPSNSFLFISSAVDEKYQYREINNNVLLDDMQIEVHCFPLELFFNIFHYIDLSKIIFNVRSNWLLVCVAVCVWATKITRRRRRN